MDITIKPLIGGSTAALFIVTLGTAVTIILALVKFRHRKNNTLEISKR